MTSRRRFPWSSTGIIAAFALIALFAGVISPADPYQQALRSRLVPPVWEATGTWRHILGTDALGRDLLSRLIFGAQISLSIGIVTVLCASVIGTAIGLTAAYYRRGVDDVLMQLTDATLSVPIILLALILGVTIGPSVQNVVIAVSTILWARFARVIRGEALMLMERDFIAQARIAGCSAARIVLVHVLPNTLNTLVVLFTLQVGYVIVIEASLSFLGAGVPLPTPAWGSMIAEGRELLNSAWWISTFPMVAICALILALNLFGDWLRDRLDPKLAQL